MPHRVLRTSSFSPRPHESLAGDKQECQTTCISQHPFEGLVRGVLARTAVDDSKNSGLGRCPLPARLESGPIGPPERISGNAGRDLGGRRQRAGRCGRGCTRPGLSLACLLAEQRGARNNTSIPKLTVKQVVHWARAFHARTDDWPTQDSGPILEAPGETWGNLDKALASGYRGLDITRTSLAQLLAVQCGVRNQMRLPRLTVQQILDWAVAHRKRTNRWPQKLSGPIPDALKDLVERG